MKPQAHDLDDVLVAVSPSAFDYGWHLLTMSMLYKSNAYYKRRLDAFKKTLSLQLGFDESLIETALIFRKCGQLDFASVAELNSCSYLS